MSKRILVVVLVCVAAIALFAPAAGARSNNYPRPYDMFDEVGTAPAVVATRDGVGPVPDYSFRLNADMGCPGTNPASAGESAYCNAGDTSTGRSGNGFSGKGS